MNFSDFRVCYVSSENVILYKSMREDKNMKTIRLILGIITVILFMVILLQSCAVGTANVINESSDMGGSAGFFLAILSLIDGVIAMATRSSAVGAFTAGGLYNCRIHWNGKCGCLY